MTLYSIFFVICAIFTIYVVFDNIESDESMEWDNYN